MAKNTDPVRVEKSNLLLDMEIAYENPVPSPDELAEGEMPTLTQMRAWLARDPKGFLKDLVKLQSQHQAQVRDMTQQRAARSKSATGRSIRAKAKDAEAMEPAPGCPPPERVEDLARQLLDDCLKAANAN